MARNNPGPKELTPLQERYCQNRVKGMGKTAAYRAAGYAQNKLNPKIDNVNAIKVDSKEKVRERINYLNSLAESGMILNREQIAAKLTDMSLDETKPDGIQLKALDQLSKVTGLYTDQTNIGIVNQINIDDKLSAIVESLQFD